MLRFLQVQRRSAVDSAAGSDSWDEAVETEVTADVTALLGEGGEGWVREFAIPGGEDREGDVIRRRERLAGAVSVRTSPVPGPWRAVRLTIRVENRTESATAPASRADALPTALVAAHLIVGVDGGEFISMTDPPEWAKPAVAACENIGAWPVLADPDGGRRVILSAPIILYDNPELAEESPGELYDGTEIDEILTLRTLALSDAEKAEARATDPRAAALIEPGRVAVAGRGGHAAAARHHPRPAPGGGRRRTPRGRRPRRWTSTRPSPGGIRRRTRRCRRIPTR